MIKVMLTTIFIISIMSGVFIYEAVAYDVQMKLEMNENVKR